MSLVVCHLSDIHFKENGNSILSKVEKLKSVIESICVSGD